MRLMIAGTFAALLFLPLSAAAESPGELWRQGYEIVWESPGNPPIFSSRQKWS